MYLFKFSKDLKYISLIRFVVKNGKKLENYLKNRNLYRHKSILLNRTLLPHVFSPSNERTHTKFIFSGIHFILLIFILESIYPL